MTNNSGVIDIFWLNAEFLSHVSGCGSRFLIIGSTGIHFYYPQRVFNDLDIMIEPTLDNARLVIETLEAPETPCHFTPSDLAQPAKHIPYKHGYYLDILTPKQDSQFETCWHRHATLILDTQHHWFRQKIASKETLIALMTESDNSKHAKDIRLLQGGR
jgi:hypothetical protein